MPEAAQATQVGPGIWQVVNRVFPSNTYICATGEPGRCLLVDPGTDPAGIDDALVKLGLEPDCVFCTHGHFDHIGSASFFQKRYGAPCYLHEADTATLGRAKFIMMALKIPFALERPQVTSIAEAPAEFGGHGLVVLPAPGHTPGGCMLLYGGGLFSGDTLFSRGVGLSKLPGGDRDALRTTLRRLWDRIPGEALVCPGHGDCSPFSTVRTQNKPLLRFLGTTGADDSPRDAGAGIT